jgi:hypothetical protein
MTVLAALVAAVIGLGLAAPGEARSRAHRPKHKSSHRVSPHRAAKRSRHRLVIRQRPTGEVVLERVTPGTFVPPTYYNYPPSPLCDPTDVVLEAHLHDAADEDEEEAPDNVIAGLPGAPPAEPAPARPGLSALARRIGSLLRPKSAGASLTAQDVDLGELISHEFAIPVQGVDRERLHDSFLASRGRYAKHLAIDIGAPRGTPVLATADGQIVRIAREKRGGKTLYQKDTSGRYLLFYCHLSGYAKDLEVGQTVKKGDVIAYVGSTGHVIGGPHLHFSITRLPDDGESFRKGLAINPYLLFLGGP